MRINIANIKKNSLVEKVLKELVNDFSKEYDITQANALTYIKNGKQGLDEFAKFLKGKGYDATAYYLPANKEFFSNVGTDWNNLSRWVPSFGIDVPDTDPQLVALKLKLI